MAILIQLLSITSPFSAMYATYRLFRFLDTKASLAANRALNAWIKGENYRNIDLEGIISVSFDNLYGENLGSLRTFIRSILYSTLCTVIFLFLIKPRGWSFSFVLLALLGLLPSTIASDYVSLFFIKKSLLLAKSSPLYSAFSALFGAIISISIVQFLGTIVLSAESGALLPILRYVLGTEKGIIDFIYLHLPVAIQKFGALHSIETFIFSPIMPIAFMVRLVEVLAHYVGTMNVDDFRAYINQHKESMNFISSAILLGLIPALLVHLWFPLFIAAVVINRILIKFFSVITRTQWIVKRGSQHPLDVIGIISSAIVLLIAAMIRLIIYLV